MKKTFAENQREATLMVAFLNDNFPDRYVFDVFGEDSFRVSFREIGSNNEYCIAAGSLFECFKGVNEYIKGQNGNCGDFALYETDFFSYYTLSV